MLYCVRFIPVHNNDRMVTTAQQLLGTLAVGY